MLVQVINGGKGSNHTIERIILESPLVQVYRNLHSTFEKNFMHAHLTSRHAEADMAKTFREAAKHMVEHSPNVVRIGRKTKHCIPDLISKGEETIDKIEREDGDGADGVDEHASIEDLAVEIGI